MLFIKNSFLIFLCFLPILTFSQAKRNGDEVRQILNDPYFKIGFQKLDSLKSTEKRFKMSGKFNLIYNNTNVLTRWIAGQDNASTFGINGTINVNYYKDKKIWDTRGFFGYGFTKSSQLNFPKKTNDIMDVNTSFAVEVSKRLYASSFSSLQTQFTKGYKYENNNNIDVRRVNSDIFSPLKVKLGIGVLWKRSNNLRINLSPITGLMIFVDPKYTLKDGSYFGVILNESKRFEFGSNLEMYNNISFFDNTINIINILNLYSNYLSQPENIDINHNLDVSITIKKFFGISYNLRLLYDDNTFPGFQIIQISGIGIVYKF